MRNRSSLLADPTSTFDLLARAVQITPFQPPEFWTLDTLLEQARSNINRVASPLFSNCHGVHASHVKAAARLLKEYRSLEKESDNQELRLSLVNPDSMMHWHCILQGPPDTPFAGGVFELDLR